MYTFPGLYMSRVGSRQASLNKLIWCTLLCYLLCSGDKICKWMAKLWDALSGKKIYSWAWSNRKPTEVQKLQSDDIPLRKSGINTDRTSKFLNNFNPKRLVFKIARGFFDIAICCFVVFFSSLLIKYLLISKREFPHTVWYLRSLLTKNLFEILKLQTTISFKTSQQRWI